METTNYDGVNVGGGYLIFAGMWGCRAQWEGDRVKSWPQTQPFRLIS